MRNVEAEEHERVGEWVLATWHCYNDVRLFFVPEIDGRPMANYWPTDYPSQAYRWNSYHAARKYRATHPRLAGYIIVNLQAIKDQCERQRKIDGK